MARSAPDGKPDEAEHPAQRGDVHGDGGPTHREGAAGAAGDPDGGPDRRASRADERPTVELRRPAVAPVAPVAVVEADPELTSTGMLETVAIDSARRPGQWWFVVIPLALIALLAAVAVNWSLGHTRDAPDVPELSPRVALPELGTGSDRVDRTNGSVSPTPSGSASRRASPSDMSATGPTTSAQATTAAATSTGYPLVGSGGRCAAPVGGASSSSGTGVSLAECNGESYQRWVLPGDGTVRTLGKCLNVMGGVTFDGGWIDISNCSGTAAQQWQRQSNGTWVNPRSQRCLTPVGGGAMAGTPLVIWACGAKGGQHWTYG